MVRDFYPFVEESPTDVSSPNNKDNMEELTVRYETRIAVYDDVAAAPRVVVIEPTEIRSYLEEIVQAVNRLSHEQGGQIPFMVMREIVENFIHAHFASPTITVLDHGNTIRFSDRGPGIKEKELALQYGTSSATESMKHYIRGVGSGLPYAQQYMIDKGGSLTIEDNISGGTVVTISTRSASDAHTQTRPSTEKIEISSRETSSQGSLKQDSSSRDKNPDTSHFSLPKIEISPRGQKVFAYLSEHELVGPTELVRMYDLSIPTWSRELKSLEEIGLIRKIGQKYQLTQAGLALL
ncbi:ATP-binding protein [Lancefieldella rimae]|uniref:ATP-binding protein n=1 Tax=Lancefieldella rimae TaxID=1383 RepID=UPI002A49EDF5|nr:ATP-binding protein [Atopobiaceae bacterium]